MNRAQDLESLEAVIADGLRSFVEVGRALSAIREGGLYREQGYKTFEGYCRERWEMNRAHAYRLVSAAELVSNWRHELAPPSNEGQARELARLKDADAQAEAWAEAVATAPETGVTAKVVDTSRPLKRPPSPSRSLCSWDQLVPP